MRALIITVMESLTRSYFFQHEQLLVLRVREIECACQSTCNIFYVLHINIYHRYVKYKISKIQLCFQQKKNIEKIILFSVIK